MRKMKRPGSLTLDHLRHELHREEDLEEAAKTWMQYEKYSYHIHVTRSSRGRHGRDNITPTSITIIRKLCTNEYNKARTLLVDVDDVVRAGAAQLQVAAVTGHEADLGSRVRQPLPPGHPLHPLDAAVSVHELGERLGAVSTHGHLESVHLGQKRS